MMRWRPQDVRLGMAMAGLLCGQMMTVPDGVRRILIECRKPTPETAAQTSVRALPIVSIAVPFWGYLLGSLI